MHTVGGVLLLSMARDLEMADDNAVDMTSDGDDDRGDILPPTKKYKQSRLAFTVASVDRATIVDQHEGDGESVTAVLVLV